MSLFLSCFFFFLSLHRHATFQTVTPQLILLKEPPKRGVLRDFSCKTPRFSGRAFSCRALQEAIHQEKLETLHQATFQSYKRMSSDSVWDHTRGCPCVEEKAGNTARLYKRMAIRYHVGPYEGMPIETSWRHCQAIHLFYKRMPSR